MKTVPRSAALQGAVLNLNCEAIREVLITNGLIHINKEPIVNSIGATP